MLFELPVEIVEHDPRFDHANAVLDVERDNAIQVFGEIDDDTLIDGLSALRGPAAARGDDAPCIAGNRQRPQRLIRGPGNHDPSRHDLIKRSVGRIPATIERVEEDLTRYLAGQTPGKGAVFGRIPRLSGPHCHHRFNLM